MFYYELYRKLDRLIEELKGFKHLLLEIKRLITQEGIAIMSALDDLTTQVKANTDLEASAITLIQGLATQISQSAGDPAKIAALSAQLNTSAAALAAAITANTTPPPPPPPPPAPAS